MPSPVPVPSWSYDSKCKDHTTLPSIGLTAVQVWGAIVCAMSTMESYSHVLVCRVFLAIIEAGFPPGVLYIMTTWYKKSEIG